jgi:hypothetical protein
MNPTDLARERWRPFRQAQEQVEKAVAAHAKARDDLAALEAQLGAAERDDELALGRTLLAGKPEPASTAAKVREEIGAQERRVRALERAHVEAQDARRRDRSEPAAVDPGGYPGNGQGSDAL